MRAVVRERGINAKRIIGLAVDIPSDILLADHGRRTNGERADVDDLRGAALPRRFDYWQRIRTPIRERFTTSGRA